MNWVDWTLIIAVVLAVLSLIDMLLYRHGHKTTIEMDLLLKQMQVTGRLRMLTGYQRERVDALENFYGGVADQWETQRAAVRARHNYDIGELPEAPEPDADMMRLFADVTEV